MADYNRNRDYSQWDEGRDPYQDRYGRESHDQHNRGEYNRVNYFPDNDENRRLDDRDYEANRFGVSGTYGYRGDEEGSYGSNRGWQNQYGRRDERDYGNYGTGYGAAGSFGSTYGGLGDYGGSRYMNNWRRERYGRDYDQTSGARDSRDYERRDDRNLWDRTRDKVSSRFDDDDRERRTERVSGPYRGKGPKGYSRSDERILEDVCDRLSDDDALDASDIEVKVQGAEVVLDGRVQTREAKRRAEDLAEDITGVRNVLNNLRVSPIEGTPTTNAVIAAVAGHNNTTYSDQLDSDKAK